MLVCLCVVVCCVILFSVIVLTCFRLTFQAVSLLLKVTHSLLIVSFLTILLTFLSTDCSLVCQSRGIVHFLPRNSLLVSSANCYHIRFTVGRAVRSQ